MSLDFETMNPLSNKPTHPDRKSIFRVRDMMNETETEDGKTEHQDKKTSGFDKFKNWFVPGAQVPVVRYKTEIPYRQILAGNCALVDLVFTPLSRPSSGARCSDRTKSIEMLLSPFNARSYRSPEQRPWKKTIVDNKNY